MKKMKKSTRKKLFEYVESIELRKGYCNEVDLYRLIDVWLLVFDDMEKYDNSAPMTQLSKMWRDLKTIYYNIQFRENPELKFDLDKVVPIKKEKDICDKCLKVCEIYEKGGKNIEDICVEVGFTGDTFRRYINKYDFLRSKYLQSKRIKSKFKKRYIKKSEKLRLE